MLVRLNSDDDDSDGVIDYDDGFDKDTLPGTGDEAMLKNNPDGSFSPVKDDELVEIHLTALPAGLSNGTVALELIQGQEQLRVWASPDKGKGNVLIEPGNVSGVTPRKEWLLGQDIDNLGALPQSIYLEGVKATPGPAVLVTKYIAPDGLETEMDRLLISVYQLALTPDYTRDGKIDEQDWNRVTADKPWRFWINDDDDGDSDPVTGLTTDTGTLPLESPDDLPGQGKDNDDEQVNGIRDLVDFFPLRLDISSLVALLPPAQGYRYLLRNVDGALGLVEGQIAGGIAAGTKLTSDGVGEYLTEPSTGIAFGEASVRVITKEGVALSEAFLQKLIESDQSGIVLLEGRQPTAEPLVLEVRDTSGALVISQSFPLEIVPVEQMYGHKNLRAVAGGPGGGINRFAGFSDPNSPDYYLKSKQPYCMQGVDKNLVWMHGYNVTSADARTTFAEVFKRFFHAGLNGRFFGVEWYGNPPAFGAPHYHQAVVNAFATAQAYKDFITSFPGSTSIAAHSLGNLVVGSAIHDHGLEGFAQYFAIDASVALEAYGQIVEAEELVSPEGTFSVDPSADMIKVEGWPDYIAAGQSRLLASEWHELFPATDNRSQLTWRNRLAKVVSITGQKVYNFFSSTEEVLRTYADDDLVWDAGGANPRIYSWVKQEKFKGRRDRIGDVPQVGMDIGGASSNYGGWSFSDSYKEPTWLPPFSRHYSPEEAASGISDDALKTSPFFALDVWHLFSDPNSILEPNLDNLVATVDGLTPSDYVLKKIAETGLKSYYTDNTPAHNKVLVRDWLLAEAFPATTLPLGANRYENLESNNIDMSGDKTSESHCCKTRELSWPRSSSMAPGRRDWWHSDYKDVPYQHTYEFYTKIKSLTGD